MEDSETLDMTPPISPLVGSEFSVLRPKISENGCSFWRFKCFNCLGEVNLKDNVVHPSGYLANGEIEFITYQPNPYVVDSNSTLHLFGFSFSEGTALLNYADMLFQLVRKEIMLLDSASKLQSNVMSAFSVAPATDVDYDLKRKEICTFFMYVRKYISCMFSDEEYSWIVEKILRPLQEHLKSMRLFMKQITDLPDYIIHHSASSHGNKCPQASYHLFHLHLDLRWHHLILSVQIDSYKCGTDMLLDSLTPSFSETRCSNFSSETEKNILLVITDLVMLAVARFGKISVTDLQKKSPFSCTCVRELWLLLLFLLDDQYEKGHGKNFWMHLGQILNNVLSDKTAESKTTTTCASLAVAKSVSCSNRGIFVLWLLLHLTQLYGYKRDGTYQEQNLHKVHSCHDQLNTTLKSILSMDSVSEVQLRVVLSLLRKLLSMWEACNDPLLLLWEYFQRRLNSTFYVPGSSPETMAVVSKTGQGLLEQVRKLLGRGATRTLAAPVVENSWGLFLSVLGNHLQQSPELWPQVRGRIYSKLSPAKLQSLTETGLYHFGCLFMTLAIATPNLQEVSKKLLDLLKLLNMEKLEVQRHLTVWKIQLALIQLHVEQGEDVGSIAVPLMSDVSTVCKSKSTDSVLLMRTFVEGLQDIINASANLELSQEKLLGGWIQVYLSYCQSSDMCRLLDTLLSIATRVESDSRALGSHCWDETVPQLAYALWEHAWPSVKTYFQQQPKATSSGSVAEPPMQAADLAAALALLTLGKQNITLPGSQPLPQLQTLLCSLIGSDAHLWGNVCLIRRFLCHILQEQRVLDVLAEQLPSYQTVLVQAWIKCSLLSSEEHSEELHNLTTVVAQLPEVSTLCAASGGTLGLVGEEPLYSFIMILGRAYEQTTTVAEKSSMRERCNRYLAPIEKCSAAVLKNPAIISGAALLRLYKVSASLVLHCGGLLYLRSTPNCLLPMLVSHLLLPHAVYRPESQLHPNVANALRRTIAAFVRGIARLYQNGDPYVNRTLRDIVLLYVPRLAPPVSASSGGVFARVTSAAQMQHPLLGCFVEDSIMGKEAEVILDLVAEVHLKVRGATPTSQHAQVALSLVMDLLQTKNLSDTVLHLVISRTLTNLLEIAMFVEEKNPCKKQAADIIRVIVTSAVFQNTSELQSQFVAIVARICQHHLAFNTQPFTRLMITLSSVSPVIVTNCLPHIKEAVTHVERLRGVGYDAGLRRSLEKIEEAAASSSHGTM
ncbi:protein MMS22-like isoform X1 [Schistocerca americana]|uniref:protein MMS22-like isoform X1 n=2 Tax=Schistocerca americana TaxID=7009 RepID=UPI001F4F335F|nr:protein MMS22-like isoform X1 [Schistocerca americana]